MAGILRSVLGPVLRPTASGVVGGGSDSPSPPTNVLLLVDVDNELLVDLDNVALMEGA